MKNARLGLIGLLFSIFPIAFVEVKAVKAEVLTNAEYGEHWQEFNEEEKEWVKSIPLTITRNVELGNEPTEGSIIGVEDSNVLSSQELEQDIAREANSLRISSDFTENGFDPGINQSFGSAESSEFLLGQEGIIENIQQEVEEVDPGRATRSSPSYIGLGVNIGLGDGDSNLGETSFLLFSKLGLLPYLSVRPSLAIEDSVTILLPITYDFSFGATGITEDATEAVGVRFAPYVGAGIALSTEDDVEVDFLATGGIDVPFATNFTANASVSATLFENPAVGLQLGIGYNFR